MKSIFFILAALFIVNYASAQIIKESEVPKSVVSAFQAKFKDAKVKKWEKEDGKYEAEFVLNKVENSAVFSADGKLLESEVEIKTSELPKAVTDYVANNYAGYKLDEAAKITSADGKITFEAEVKKGKESIDLLFDDKGTFIKKKVETPGKEEDKD